MYFIKRFGGFNPILPQNRFKIFPQISGLENIDFVKGLYGDLAINIKVVPFNLYRWLRILIHKTNTLINL